MLVQGNGELLGLMLPGLSDTSSGTRRIPDPDVLLPGDSLRSVVRVDMAGELSRLGHSHRLSEVRELELATDRGGRLARSAKTGSADPQCQPAVHRHATDRFGSRSPPSTARDPA